MGLRSLFVNYELGAIPYGDNDIRAIQDWMDELLNELRFLQ